MTHETEYEKIRELYSESTRAMFAVGGILRVLEQHGVTQHEMRVNLPFSHTTARVLMDAHEAVDKNYVAKRVALEIGHTKAAMVTRERKHSGRTPLVDAVHARMTVAEFSAYLRGRPIVEGVKDFVFKGVTPADNIRLTMLLEKFGATRQGRGLEKKTEALASLIDFLEQCLAEDLEDADA